MGVVTRAKLQRGDQANFDGVTKTSSRVDATGSTVTGLTLGECVDILQVYGNTDQRTVAAINAAMNYIGSSRNVTLLFATGTWTIDSNVTITGNYANYIPAGCVFDISSGVTLTFSGPVHVEYSDTDGTGWYTGSGTVSCSVGASGFPGW